MDFLRMIVCMILGFYYSFCSFAGDLRVSMGPGKNRAKLGVKRLPEGMKKNMVRVRQRAKSLDEFFRIIGELAGKNDERGYGQRTIQPVEPIRPDSVPALAMVLDQSKAAYQPGEIILPVEGKIVPVKIEQSVTINQPVLQTAVSQTESYLGTLGETRELAYKKIHEVLQAPDPSMFKKSWADSENMRKDRANFTKIDPWKFDKIINKIIVSEKQNPDYYALYNGNNKGIMFFHLFVTYLAQLQFGWNRDDFYIMRNLHEFYPYKAETAADYIRQNMVPDYHQRISSCLNQPWVDIRKQYVSCLNRDPKTGKEYYYSQQFDMSEPVRSQMISVSPAFVAGVDDAPMNIRLFGGSDFAAWESSFYYFATNLSWSNFSYLYSIIERNIKFYCPDLFTDGLVNRLARKYLSLRFSMLPALLLSHKKDNDSQDLNAGMVYQILVPKDILDKVAYLSWINGAVWQRKIANITAGWNDDIGIYTKLSPILDILKSDPKRLGRSLHLLQARLLFKDKKYLFDPTSPIKMKIFTAMPESRLRAVKDILRSMARFVYDFKEAQSKDELELWAEKVNLKNEIEKLTVFKGGQLNAWFKKLKNEAK